MHASSNHMLRTELGSWKTELNDVVDSWTLQVNKSSRRAKSTSSSPSLGPDQHASTVNPTIVEEEYVIDPITNRKVSKKRYGSFKGQPAGDASPRTFKTYRSHFSAFVPPETKGQLQQEAIHSDGPPPPEELTKYRDVGVEPDLSPSPDLSPTQSGVGQSEEYSLNHLPPEEAAEILEDIDKYKPVEYDAVQSIAVESDHQKYDDLHKYSPTEYDEVLEAKESSEKYEDLDAYRSSQYDQAESTQESGQKYEDLHQYKPYRYNEPEAPAKGQAPEVYEDLHKYIPYMHNESAPHEEVTPAHKDLDKYEASNHQHEAVGFGGVAERYEDLDQYKLSEFLDGAKVEQSAPAYEDLSKYDQPYLHEEDEVAPVTQQKYGDLNNYRPKNFDDHAISADDTPFQQYGDLNKYKAYRVGESGGKSILDQDIVAASLEEYDMKKEARENLEQSLRDHITASDVADKEASVNVQLSRQNSNQPLQSSVTGNFVRDFPEEFTNTWSSSASGLQRQSSSSLQEQEIQAILETAEEKYAGTFAQATDASILQTALDRQLPKSRLETVLDRNKRPLSRRPKQVSGTYDPFSTRPQGLETSYAEEHGTESPKTPFVKIYGTFEKPAATEPTKASEPATPTVSLEELLEDNPATPQASSSSSIDEPTIYKILAYDSTMQKVDIAETTSIVPDQAAPLTPAEVLLRLSNPAKFFPHFAPLQAQGFEIVSGGGDVLVFRKTRSVEVGRNPANPINPIDMMGAPFPSPSAAAFVSPTGFVNYDPPQPEEQRATPFRSGIDVRREEPVFSGPKAAAQSGTKTKRKKRSVTKRVLIGGVWIAGLSYSLGVIGEYFTTGGVDGKGPTGF